MTRKQLNDIAAQIERTYNSRHTDADMQITTEIHIADRIAWITITPAESENFYGATIYYPEDCPCQRAQSRACSSYAECSRAWAIANFCLSLPFTDSPPTSMSSMNSLRASTYLASTSSSTAIWRTEPKGSLSSTPPG